VLLRVLLVTSLLVGALGLLPTVAHAQSTTTTVAQQPPGLYDCGTTQYRVLFWPQGHQAVPGVGFTPYPIPHLELYSGTGAAYPGDQFDVFIGAQGSGNVSKTCTPMNTRKASPKQAKLKKITDAATVTCKFSKKPIVEPSFGVPGLASLTLTDPPSSKALFAQMQQTGSYLQYDSSRCKVGPPPT